MWGCVGRGCGGLARRASYSNLFADGRWLVRLREKPWQPTLLEGYGTKGFESVGFEA